MDVAQRPLILNVNHILKPKVSVPSKPKALPSAPEPPQKTSNPMWLIFLGFAVVSAAVCGGFSTLNKPIMAEIKGIGFSTAQIEAAKIGRSKAQHNSLFSDRTTSQKQTAALRADAKNVKTFEDFVKVFRSGKHDGVVSELYAENSPASSSSLVLPKAAFRKELFEANMADIVKMRIDSPKAKFAVSERCDKKPLEGITGLKAPTSSPSGAQERRLKVALRSLGAAPDSVDW